MVSKKRSLYLLTKMTYDKQDNIAIFFYELSKYKGYISFHIIVHMLQNLIHKMKKKNYFEPNFIKSIVN